MKTTIQKLQRPLANTSNGYDRRWLDVINEVLENRGTGLKISDIKEELWEKHIGPMIDAIEHDQGEELVRFEK